MLTAVMIIAIWVLLSLPLSVVLGLSFRDDRRVELVGMDGADVVYRRADGTLERVALAARASH
jgi:ABC-type spermidine/putrescine transport system permease subunit II